MPKNSTYFECLKWAFVAGAYPKIIIKIKQIRGDQTFLGPFGMALAV